MKIQQILDVKFLSTKAEKELGSATKRRLRSAGIEVPQEKYIPCDEKNRGKR